MLLPTPQLIVTTPDVMPGAYKRRRSSSICLSDIQAASHISTSKRRPSYAQHALLASHPNRRRASSISAAELLEATIQPTIWRSVNHFIASTVPPLLTSTLALTQRPMLGRHDVPMELVLLILEFTAASSKRAALSVSLVCKYARVIAAPLVFHYLVFSGFGESIRRYLRFVAYAEASQATRAPRSTLLLSSIRELWTGPYSVPPAVLASCMGLKRLAIEPQSYINYCLCGDEEATDLHYLLGMSQVISKTLPPLRVKELVLLSYPCDWTHLNHSNPFTQMCLSSITHLWLTDPLLVYSTHLRVPLSSFTSLMNVAIKVNMPLPVDDPDEIDILTTAYQELKKSIRDIKMIVFILYSSPTCRSDSPRLLDLSTYLRSLDKRISVLTVNLPQSCGGGRGDGDVQLLPFFRSSEDDESKLWRKARIASKTSKGSPDYNYTTEYQSFQSIIQVR